MLTITLILLICQHLSASWSTRLPLEVYELQSSNHAAAAAAAVAAKQSATEATLITLNQNYKNLEYSTVHASQLNNNNTSTVDSNAAGSAKTTETVLASLDAGDVAGNQQQQQDRRRARQMYDIMQQQQQQQQHHRFSHDAIMHAQRLPHDKENKKHTSSHINSQDVRILYQVGDSEQDLPICAPNAVCSKIDLYETPWIERQCRCPEVNHLPGPVVIHHHHHSNGNNNNNNNKPYNRDTSDKYRLHYERENHLQQKRLLLADFGDNKKFESLHLKKLMQKLGAVYEDDLHIQPSDYFESSNDALLSDSGNSASVEDVDLINNNEFPHSTEHRYSHAAGLGHNLRHSAHMGHGVMSYIGGCPSGLGIEDGHTIADKTRHYKLCQPVHKLPVCKHFRDYTWTLRTSSELNVTEQIVHCRCPKNSVTYLTKREPADDGSNGYTYLFACSPLTRIRCQRKQPCKLFTVRKRQEFIDEVNINALCQCPKGHHCPSHHTQSGVISGESFLEDNIQTYSGYCMAND